MTIIKLGVLLFDLLFIVQSKVVFYTLCNVLVECCRSVYLPENFKKLEMLLFQLKACFNHFLNSV